MITPADLPPPSSRLDPEGMLAVAAIAGMEAARNEDMPAARELASTLMGQEVVSIPILEAVQAIQPAATLIFREEGKITGVWGQLMLRPSAIEPFFDGRFDALDLDTDYLARPGELIGLGYFWGIAATTKLAATASFQNGALIRPRLFPDLTIVTKAVTPIGRHLALNRYGYQPLRHPDDDLFIRLFAREAAAAAA
jgi:hypothetical protein